jgi:hypothetical protein
MTLGSPGQQVCKQDREFFYISADCACCGTGIFEALPQLSAEDSQVPSVENQPLVLVRPTFQGLGHVPRFPRSNKRSLLDGTGHKYVRIASAFRPSCVPLAGRPQLAKASALRRVDSMGETGEGKHRDPADRGNQQRECKRAGAVAE